MGIILFIWILIVGIFSVFFLLPYWAYLFIAAFIFFTTDNINFMVVLCLVLGIIKFINRKKGSNFKFKRTYYYYDNREFFNQFKYRNSYNSQFSHMQTESEYDRACKVLGVDKESSMDEKKRKYLQLLKKYHPDINHTTEAAEKTKEINDAWDIIQKYQNEEL